MGDVALATTLEVILFPKVSCTGETPLEARIIRQLGVAQYPESKLLPALQARLKQFRLTAEGSGVLR